MTKTLHMLSITAISIMFAALFGAGMSSGQVANAEPATVIRDFGCVLIAADGGPGFTTDTQVTINGNNTIFTCLFDDVPNDTGKAKRFSGFLCGTQSGLTTNSMSVVSASGKALLRCIIHNNP